MAQTKPKLEMIIEEDEGVEYTFDDLNKMLDAGIMLEYLDRRSKLLREDPDMVFGYIQGWNDRKKFHQETDSIYDSGGD